MGWDVIVPLISDNLFPAEQHTLITVHLSRHCYEHEAHEACACVNEKRGLLLFGKQKHFDLTMQWITFWNSYTSDLAFSISETQPEYKLR